MFSYMTDVFALGFAVSVIACLIGIAAEGRFAHFLKVLVGLVPRRESLNRYDEVDRPEINWDIVGTIKRAQIVTGEIPTSRFISTAAVGARQISGPSPVADSFPTAKHDANAATSQALRSAAREAAAAVRLHDVQQAPDPIRTLPQNMPPSVKPRRRVPQPAQR